MTEKKKKKQTYASEAAKQRFRISWQSVDISFQVGDERADVGLNVLLLPFKVCTGRQELRFLFPVCFKFSSVAAWRFSSRICQSTELELDLSIVTGLEPLRYICWQGSVIMAIKNPVSRWLLLPVFQCTGDLLSFHQMGKILAIQK